MGTLGTVQAPAAFPDPSGAWKFPVMLPRPDPADLELTFKGSQTKGEAGTSGNYWNHRDQGAALPKKLTSAPLGMDLGEGWRIPFAPASPHRVQQEFFMEGESVQGPSSLSNSIPALLLLL